MEEKSWKILANWLDCFPAVLDALLVHLEMTALALASTDGGTFETHHHHLGGGHILAPMAHHLEILGMCWWLFENCVSC